MESIEVSIELENKSIEKCELIISHTPSYKISFTGIGLEQLEFESYDLFGATILLREVLEHNNCKLLCNAARENIVISRMSSQMGGGRKGYIVEMGKQGHPDNLVDIFLPTSSELAVSVEEQKLFKKNWHSSLGNKKNKNIPRKRNWLTSLVWINIVIWPIHYVLSVYTPESFSKNMLGAIIGMNIGGICLYFLEKHKNNQNKDTF